MRSFLSKKAFQQYLHSLMREAIRDGRIKHDPACIRQVTVCYQGCQMTLNTSFDCLDRTARRLTRLNAKRREGKNLLNAVEKFNESPSSL